MDKTKHLQATLEWIKLASKYAKTTSMYVKLAAKLER